MPEQPATERTEQPTPRKLRKAKEKGQLPQSQELTSTVTLISLISILALFGPSLSKWFVQEMKLGMACRRDVFVDTDTFLRFCNGIVFDTIIILSPIFVALLVGSILGSVIVSGLNFSSGALQFKFSQLNPVEGFKNLFNAKSAVRLLASILKLLVISLVVWYYLKSRLDDFASFRWTDADYLLPGLGKIVIGLMIRISIVLLVISLGDTLFQKWKYIQDLKMTREEVKQDHKETEGSPELKRRIRKAQFDIAFRRTLREVPKATVVLVNPTHYAVALRYEAKTMNAPVLLAKGADYQAEKIREIARAYGVPIISRPELTRTIYASVKAGEPIPESLYIAVAQVLSIVYRLRNRNIRRK